MGILCGVRCYGVRERGMARRFLLSAASGSSSSRSSRDTWGEEAWH